MKLGEASFSRFCFHASSRLRRSLIGSLSKPESSESVSPRRARCMLRRDSSLGRLPSCLRASASLSAVRLSVAGAMFTV